MFHHKTRYQTAWVRVPTTNYRPVIAYDPVTGVTRSDLQPCTTYTWQVQRVPYRGFGTAPAYFSDGTAAPVGYVVSPAPGLAGSGTCNTCAPATPYYSIPTTAPTVSPLAPPIPDSTRTIPGSSGWSPSRGTSDAASQPPTLAPGEAQGLQNMQPVPTIRNYTPIPLSDPVETRKAQEPANEEPKPKLDVQPVPDPDARIDEKQIPAAPTLFDANDRTALRLLRSPGMLAPIVWPETTRSDEVRTARNDSSATAQSEPAPKDTGTWRVVRP